MHLPPDRKPGRRRSLILIYGTALISVMGVASILPVLPDMALAFGLAEADVGVLVYSFTLPGIALAPVGGILADRLGRKAVLVPCLLLFALGGFMASFAQGLQGYIVWRMVQGCGAACLGVLYNTIIGDLYFQEHHRLRIMGFAATALSLGAALYPALGGALGEVSWRWPLRLALLSLPLALLAALTPLPPLAQRGSMLVYARQMKDIICGRDSLVHFTLTLCAFCILYGPMITYFPLLAHAHFDANPARIGGLFALSALGTALASAFLGPLALRLPSRWLIASGALCFGLSMCGLILLGQGSSGIWLLSLPVLLYGLGQGLSYPTVMTSLSSLAPNEGRGVLMAVNGMVLRLAQSVAPFLCGLVYTLGGFFSVFGLGLAVAGLMLFLGVYYFTPKHT